jgi:hypothetical protein
MGESARDEAQWLPNALPLWELHLCGSCECSKPWLERQTSIKLGPQGTIRKVLKCRCLKRLWISHLVLICMSYDQKKGWESNWAIWFPTTNPLKAKVKWGLIGAYYTPLKISFQELYNNVLALSKKTRFENDINVQSFGTTKVLVLGLPLGNPGEKWHLDVVPVERHKIYYREGVVLPPKGCGLCKACVEGCPY